MAASTQTAAAYDTGPHAEITQDAMTAEGFDTDAIGLARVNNWFVDLYENGHKNPYSGHGGFWKRLLTGVITTEGWDEDVMDAADRSHFDSATSTAFNTIGVTAEWDRLRRTTWTLVREARDEDDPAKLLSVLGITLHQVQDFYTHTNWIEPQGAFGGDGPDWHGRGYGTNPTWFDVPADVRDGVTVYTANTQGHFERQHGNWNGYKGDRTLATAMNKDWPGRPLFVKSATTAYFATRQWIQAVHSWVDDEAFWQRAMAYRAGSSRPTLQHDLRGSYEVSLYGGHWQGQGEPKGGTSGAGGSLLSLRQAIKHYFGLLGTGVSRGRTQNRARFENLILRVADKTPTGELGPVPSSQPIQQQTRFVVLRISNLKGINLGDPLPIDEADMYATVRVDGQEMHSAVINGNDSFSFKSPYAPFTWIKAIPATLDRGEPVESVEVDVRTGNRRGAGTDEDVFLRLGDRRYPLDKRLYDDFERGDRDTYSVPIDDAVRDGLTVGDITRVAVEKSGKGSWLVGGYQVRVNGRVVADQPAVNRWLQDGRHVIEAADFTASDPHGTKLPVWLRLDEDDFGPDDDGDINPYDRRQTVALGYEPGTVVQEATKGGGKFGGRVDDGDEARIEYSLETYTPELITPQQAPPPPPPPPPPAERPDLVVTAFSAGGVTVTNQGRGAAGPFRLRASNPSSAQFLTFAGLAPGASESRTLSLGCSSNYVAEVDDLNQVVEANETNNTKDSEPIIC